MCGPLAACIVGPSGNRGSFGYQIGRLGSYSLLGGLAGGLGSNLSSSVAAHVSWLGAGLLLLSATGVLGSGTWGGGWLASKVLRRVAAWGAGGRGFALGMVTALLPCGVLASAVLVAMATTSAVDGMIVMAAFVMGTMPLLLAGQLGWGILVRSRWASRVPWLQRAAMGAGALMLIYRGWILAQGANCHVPGP